MFQDGGGLSCEFPSSWRRTLVKEESSTQCNLLEITEGDAQTELGVDAGVCFHYNAYLILNLNRFKLIQWTSLPM